MRSSVRQSRHKEPNQCRLELKEGLQQFPLEFSPLFFALPFPNTSVMCYVRAWAIIQNGPARRKLDRWSGPVSEWRTRGFIFPVSEPAGFCSSDRWTRVSFDGSSSATLNTITRSRLLGFQRHGGWRMERDNIYLWGMEFLFWPVIKDMDLKSALLSWYEHHIFV